MGIFKIIIWTVFVRNVGIYGLQNLSRDYVLSFFPFKKSVSSFEAGYYRDLLLNTGLFKSVIIQTKGEDTIDIIVIVEEKGRFSIIPVSEITPSNNYTFGLKMVDRFFLKREKKLILEGYFLNLKELGFYLEDYRWKIFPVFKGKISEYRYPEGTLIFEGEGLMGFFKKSNNFYYSFFYGFGSSKSYKDEEKFLVFLNDLRFNFNLLEKFLNSRLDVYPLKRIHSGFYSVFSFTYPLNIFLFLSKIKLFFNWGYVPYYRKIIFGGQRNLKSYPFMESIGKNGYIFDFEFIYPILTKVGENPGIEFLLFEEVGNTFNEYAEILKKRALKGFGLGLRFKLLENQTITFFASINQRREKKFTFTLE